MAPGFLGSRSLAGDILQATSSLPPINSHIQISPLECLEGSSFWGSFPVPAVHFFLAVIPGGMTWFVESRSAHCYFLHLAPAPGALNHSSCQGPG